MNAKRSSCSSLALVLSSIPLAAHARSQAGACQPDWLETFGGDPGMNATVQAVASFDDQSGAGTRLYAGGSFTTVEGLPLAHIACWDGVSWAPLGAGVNGPVSSMLVFDDGSGPALHVGGGFTNAGGGAANGIARWDGTTWSALGSGLLPGAGALAVFDDGGGPELYAGGSFTSAGGVAASGIAKWDGTTWSALGSGVSGASNGVGPIVRALAVFDDGSGPALFVGGTFLTAGGSSANHIAKWDGASWTALGTGLTGCPYPLPCAVSALAVFDDGGGAELYVGGTISLAGGVFAPSLARWDGVGWAPVDLDLGGDVLALASFDEGSGPALYVGGDVGSFDTGVFLLAWNGAVWEVPGGGVVDRVHTLGVHDDGSGPALIAAGDFTSAGNAEAHRIGRYDGAGWTSLADPPVGDTVRALIWFDDGSGAALFAGGDFTVAGGTPVQRVARREGTSWTPLGSGMNGVVRSFAAFDDGAGGPTLHAAGDFTAAGGVAASRVARWDGASWAPLGSAFLNNRVLAMTSFDDGSGPVLCVGGEFTQVDGVTSRRFARWDGTSWILQGGQGFQSDVRALLVFDNGNGPALYAGGDFTYATGTSNANGIARLVGGSVWASLGGGLPSASIHALAAFDTGGGGPALHAGGTYVDAGGQRLYGVWRWNGASWLLLGAGTNGEVHSLMVFDDFGGGGPALYAGGLFTLAGGSSAERIARWNGTSWAALAGGLSGAVEAMTAFTGGGGAAPALFVGGDFGTSPTGDRYLARWQSCQDTSAPTLTCPSAIVRRDGLASAPGEIVHFTVTAEDDQDADPEVICVPASGSHFPPGTTLVTCTATDDSGNSSSCEFAVSVIARIRR